MFARDQAVKLQNSGHQGWLGGKLKGELQGWVGEAAGRIQAVTPLRAGGVGCVAPSVNSLPW